MILEKLEVRDCRNIKCISFEPDKELTVISGKNGQGKTNLLECVWLLTGSKSFRSSKDLQLVRQGEEFATISGKTKKSSAEKNIKINIYGETSHRKGRVASVNGVDYGRAASIAGIFTAVVFEPDHLGLIKGSPEGRRKFIDGAMCQLYPGYISTLRRFQRALSQKNALLKNYFKTPDADFILDSFDEELSLSGSEISRRRFEYLEMLIPIAISYYDELSRGSEIMEMEFVPCCEEGKLKELLYSSRQNDIRAGFSTKGPHREDIEISINGRSARMFGSQGQQRSSVLSIKLAEAACAEKICGEHPVMLLDDVLSELDETRQQYLLTRMQDKQCIVTTCDASAFSRTAGKVVKIEKGKLY